MLPCVTEVKSNDPAEKHSWLFERVAYFHLDEAPGACMRTDAVQLNRVKIATVRSTGHVIGLKESVHSTFIAPVNGIVGVEESGKSLSAAAGESLLLPTGYRTTYTRTDNNKPFLALMALVPSLGGSTCPGVSDRDVPEARPAHRAVRDLLQYLIAEHSRPDSPLKGRRSQQSTEALLLDLFEELQNGMIGPLARTPPAASKKQLLMAEEIMRVRSDEPLTIEQVAQDVGVSTRALQAAFRKHRGTTPRAALSTIRLTRARQLLQTAGQSATVTDIALECGFSHFGRFAQAYRARYGELPSQTLQRGQR